MKTSQSSNRNPRPLIQLPKMNSGTILSVLGIVALCFMIWLIYAAASSSAKEKALRSETNAELIVHQPHTIEIVMPAASNDKVSVREKRYLIDQRRLRDVSYHRGCGGITSLAIDYRPPNKFSDTIYIYGLTFEEWTRAFNQLEGENDE